MRALIPLALAISISTSAVPEAWSWGTIVYDHSILVRQREECLPRGPHPDLGCDQCLPYAYMPLHPWNRIFCGEASTDWCPWRWENCDACNGSCAIIYRKDPFRWVSVLADLGPVHDVIENCSEWRWQTYGQGPFGPVSGAYGYGEELSWIPPHQRDYIDLLSDPVYLTEVYAYTGESAGNIEAAWQYRIGLFAVMVESARTSADRDHYERAANLCAWYSIIRFAPPGSGEQMLAAAGFPAHVTGQEWDDLEMIQEVTCSAPFILDCWDTVAPATWGAIKSLYRD